MDLNRQKEQFSFAYVRAVISACGFNAYRLDVDEGSVDLGVAAFGPDGTARSPHLGIQMKCTADPEALKGDGLHFPLRLKNYDDLRDTRLHVPKILVVLLVPEEVEEWLDQDENALLMRRCAYWLSLRGFPQSETATTKTVVIPRPQMFNVQALKEIMQRISEGGEP